MYKRSIFSIFLPTLVMFNFIDNSHPNGCEVVSQSFALHFPIDQRFWASFLVFIGSLYIILGGLSTFGSLLTIELCLLVFWLLSFSSLYILDINILSDIWFTNIFSHPMGWLFTQLILSLKFSSSICLFIFCYLWLQCHSQEIIDNCYKAFVLCFLLRVL